MKKHAIIFASLALSCLVLSAPLAAGAVSPRPDRDLLTLHHHRAAGTARDRTL